MDCHVARPNRYRSNREASDGFGFTRLPARPGELVGRQGGLELLWLPVISFACSLVVMAVFGLGMLGIGLPEQGGSVSPGIYVLGFCMYVALSYVTIYFNAAVIGTAMKRLQGEDRRSPTGSRSRGSTSGRSSCGR